MPLSDPLPDNLLALHNDLASGEQPILSAESDILPDGTFGTQWLTVTQERVRVLDPDGDVLHDLPIVDLQAIHAEMLVGGGALQATVEGRPIDLVRYSNQHERTFAKIAKYLDDARAYHDARRRGQDGKTPSLAEEEEEDQTRCPECGLLLRDGSKVCPACINKSKVVRRLLGYMKPFWKDCVLVSGVMIASTLFSLIPPYLTKPLVDQALRGKTDADVPGRLHLLGMLVLVLLGARIVQMFLQMVQSRTNAKLGTGLSHSLRTLVFNHMQTQSLKFYNRHRTGSLMARIGHDTVDLQHALIDGVPFFASNIIMLLGIAAILFTHNWQLALLVLLPGPVVFYLSRRYWKRMHRFRRRTWHTRSRMNAYLSDAITGARVVKAFAQEPAEVTRFDDHSGQFMSSARDFEYFWAKFSPILMLLTTSGGLIVWYIGGRGVIFGDMTIGTLVMFNAYLAMFYGPLRFLSRVTDWLARALTSAERIFEVLDSRPDVPEADDPVSIPKIEGHVEMKNITFGYDAHKPVLKDVTLDVKPGEMIGLVGKSGAGKSTTINIICRMYDVQEGEILIDGVNIRNIAQHDLRSQIGVVLQETFLFNDTILENIRYANPDASLEDVMASAKAANAHDFIVKKPDGYDTIVGERGETLSGGERQRISIARAILHNPRILILDEATSSVDTDTEAQIQEAIARLVKGRTTFAIAHRLSTLRNADRLVVLKDGEVAETGSHAELIEAKGEFYRLVQMQQKMSEIVQIGG